MKHSATLGLRIKLNVLTENLKYIDAGKKILIISSPEASAIKKLKPDIVIFTGLKTGIQTIESQQYLPQI